jgi:hypothetical protein
VSYLTQPGAPMTIVYRTCILVFAAFTIAGAILGALFLSTLTSAEGAPQEAAIAAVACACAVVPYVLLRAVQLTLLAMLRDPAR